MKKLSKINVKSENFAFFTAQNLAARRVSSFDFPLRGIKEMKITIAILTREHSRRDRVRGPEWQKETFQQSNARDDSDSRAGRRTTAAFRSDDDFPPFGSAVTNTASIVASTLGSLNFRTHLFLLALSS